MKKAHTRLTREETRVAMPKRLQAKLTVGSPNHPAETEADQMAEQVMRMEPPQDDVAGQMAQSLPEEQEQLSMMREALPGEEEPDAAMEPMTEEEDSAMALKRKATSPEAEGETDVSDIVARGIAGGGHPLDAETRAFMEPRFGHDFSHVRVHTDGAASQSANDVQARAYTVGQDVVFREGEYAPGGDAGKRLLAHELTHVVQQGNLVRRAPKGETSGIVQMPESTVIGNRKADMSSRISTAVLSAFNRAELNAIKFAQQVESACEAFRNYAIPKVKEMEGEISAGELAQSLVSSVGGVIVGAIAAKAVSKIGVEIVKFVGNQVAKKLADKAKQVVSNKNDINSLEQVIKDATTAARDGATMLQDAISENIKPITNRICEKVTTGEDFSNDEHDFIASFYMASPDLIDENLERYGVPRAVSAVETHLKVYSNLVMQFEKKHIWAQASFREKLEMGFARDFGAEELTQDYKARQLANQASAERKEKLESSTVTKR